MDEPSSVERLWEEFKLKASADARERLILHYAPLVKYVAGRVSVGLPPSIEQADRGSRAPSSTSCGRSTGSRARSGSRLGRVEKAYVALENRLHTKAVLQLRAKMQDAR